MAHLGISRDNRHTLVTGLSESGAGDEVIMSIAGHVSRAMLSRYSHPTQKPVDLMRRPILNHTKRGELVYEPFLGSGTTLAAAEITERVCSGMELDPKYVDVIVQRWQTISSKKATLDGDGRTFEEIAAERQKAAA